MEKEIKTARGYVESEYGTAKLARTMLTGDVESILDLIQDYGDYLADYSAKQAIIAIAKAYRKEEGNE